MSVCVCVFVCTCVCVKVCHHTGGVELHKLHILVLETSSCRHGCSVPSARVSRGAAEVRPPSATRGEDSVLSLEPTYRETISFLHHRYYNIISSEKSQDPNIIK